MLAIISTSACNAQAVNGISPMAPGSFYFISGSVTQSQAYAVDYGSVRTFNTSGVVRADEGWSVTYVRYIKFAGAAPEVAPAIYRTSQYQRYRDDVSNRANYNNGYIGTISSEPLGCTSYTAVETPQGIWYKPTGTPIFIRIDA